MHAPRCIYKISIAVLFVAAKYLSVKNWLNALWHIKGILYGHLKELGNASYMCMG